MIKNIYIFVKKKCYRFEKIYICNVKEKEGFTDIKLE